jgi:hypothetical protein
MILPPMLMSVVECAMRVRVKLVVEAVMCRSLSIHGWMNNQYLEQKKRTLAVS